MRLLPLVLLLMGAAAPAPKPAAIRPLPPPAHPKDLEPAPGRIEPAGPLPAPERPGALLLTGATVHPVVGPALPRGDVLVRDGRIVAVGVDVPAPPGADAIALEGLHVYPGLVAGGSILGLVEIGAVRATRDYAEVGEINPQVRAEVGVEADSELIPVARSNGVLAAMTAPRGGLVSGQAALLELDGWTWEEMTVRAPVGVVVDWPDMAIDRSARAAKKPEEQERARDEAIEKIRAALENARAHARAREAREPGLPVHDRDVKWEALARAARREIPLLVEADTLPEIHAALRLADEVRVDVVIEGGRDAWRVAEELARRKVRVLLGSVMEIGRPWEPYDVNFRAPLELHRAGVEFAIVPGGGREASNLRNMPYVAAKAVAFGLPPEVALRAITLAPARILGAGDRLGSLEPGKDATLIVTDGDVLDGRTNVRRAFIRGAELDLSDRHKRLYERYRRKPRPGAEGK